MTHAARHGLYATQPVFAMRKHHGSRATGGYTTLESLAQVLEVPIPYFYAADVELAEWIKCFLKLDNAHRENNFYR
jgi:hypothetical protein